MAKHVLGFANFGGGGCIVVGVEQEEGGHLNPIGLPALTDKTKVLDGLNEYLPDALRGQVNLMDFSFQESEYPKLKGKSFQVLLVGDDPAHLPFLAAKDGANVRRNTIYTRRGAATQEADHDELQLIVSRRLETGYSSRSELDLRTHLEQLKILFEQLSPYTIKNPFSGVMATAGLFGAFAKRVPNRNYPEEDYDMFVARTIARKKRRIEIELDIEDVSASDEF